MTNKELRAQLLIEAADALNESGARQKYLGVIANKQDNIKKQIEKEKRLIDHGKSDSKLKELREKYDDLADEAARYSARVGTGTTMSSEWNGSSRESGISARNDVDRDGYLSRYRSHDTIDNKNNIRSKLNDKDTMHGNNRYDLGAYNRYGTGSYPQSIASYDIEAKKDFKKDFSGKKGSELQKRINERAKAKNESVADLLMEAAYMLIDED